MKDPQAVQGEALVEEEEEEPYLAPLIRLIEGRRAMAMEECERCMALHKELSLKLRRLVITETTLELLQLELEQEDIEMLERLQAEVTALHGQYWALRKGVLPTLQKMLHPLEATMELLQEQTKMEKEGRPVGGGVLRGGEQVVSEEAQAKVRDQMSLSERSFQVKLISPS
jgi:hypothetical protein